ncbi:hypothetical protein EC973_005902 [Apophysomyces ossiformis]|uniref:Uncharacterized protein n=1 Tax=Apophysomyces ossiformis TaxID=679940 RepID=A0A8H7BNT6_9FUNG|nr:hypothetical protein EC973_005902 [Apophysomyces ossiformis]
MLGQSLMNAFGNLSLHDRCSTPIQTPGTVVSMPAPTPVTGHATVTNTPRPISVITTAKESWKTSGDRSNRATVDKRKRTFQSETWKVSGVNRTSTVHHRDEKTSIQSEETDDLRTRRQSAPVSEFVPPSMGGEQLSTPMAFVQPHPPLNFHPNPGTGSPVKPLPQEPPQPPPRKSMSPGGFVMPSHLYVDPLPTQSEFSTPIVAAQQPVTYEYNQTSSTPPVTTTYGYANPPPVTAATYHPYPPSSNTVGYEPMYNQGVTYGGVQPGLYSHVDDGGSYPIGEYYRDQSQPGYGYPDTGYANAHRPPSQQQDQAPQESFRPPSNQHQPECVPNTSVQLTDDTQKAADKKKKKDQAENKTRQITVQSINKEHRVWINVEPTETGLSLAEKIHIIATFRTRKILSITTASGRQITLDNRPIFGSWMEMENFENGEPWKVEWGELDKGVVDRFLSKVIQVTDIKPKMA